MTDRHRTGRALPVGLVLVAALLLSGTAYAVTTGTRPAVRAASPALAPPRGGDVLTADIGKQQAAVARVPRNDVAWAFLALDYTQQAKVTVNPAYYPKAQGALARSLAIHPHDNIPAIAAEAALKSALHDFAGARTAALRGIGLDRYNSTLYGSLADADTQLGRYADAFAAVRRMNELAPGVPAYTRASYVYELRGRIGAARAALDAALVEATAPADHAFVRYYLGELAFSQGDARGALAQYAEGLRADPRYFALLEGRAKAEAALGLSREAIRDYTAVVSAVPQPEYVVEFGDYLRSLGRNGQARAQYAVFGAENRIFAANGVALDTDPTLFYADHGRPDLALRYGRAGIRIRPFVEMDDAYAWALHAAGRDQQAQRWSTRAMRLGTRNALFAFHAGMIERSLGHRGAARALLVEALSINPHFSPIHAPEARRALAAL